MLMEVDRPPIARPSARQLALPLMPLAAQPAPPPIPRDAAPTERVWLDLGATARARVRRTFVAVLREMRRDRVGG